METLKGKSLHLKSPYVSNGCFVSQALGFSSTFTLHNHLNARLTSPGDREACDNYDVILEVLPASGSPVALSSGVLSSVPAKKVRVEEDDDSSSVYGSSLHSSPTASPAPIDRSSHKRQSTSNQKNKQRWLMKSQSFQTISSNSYDIDNIVIPHSMAASTRVEKLEYKEIPTPKWRIVPYVPNNVYSSKSASHEEEDEDVSEEAVAARHSRSEELERKKFLQYLHMQVTSRSSRSRRTDSSGTNTPGEGAILVRVKVLLVASRAISPWM
ncbi:KAT8 regulatory NSL complex subunit 1 [Portunus trituberculatus]|uniref:KAT8 regulatory NSL complex subunit 1 n=1 Tax=Portunus trituberculatus TaxID=210409 RepID=A0A5B7ECI4_PORTR|nr:KAT8 regulatory NSL complex subunit 1 [Portunus trituberculatus]